MSLAVPALVVITDRHAAARAGRSLREVVAAAVDAGAPAVLLRDKDLDYEDRYGLGAELQPVIAAAGAALFVSSDPDLARRLGADGIHLAAADPPCFDLPPTVRFVGRSCHDVSEVIAARDETAPDRATDPASGETAPSPDPTSRRRVPYAFASPVAVSASKPGHGPALGPGGLRWMITAAPGLPILALGGVTPDNAPVWRAAGAHGIAVMGGVMAADDPAGSVRALLTSWADTDDAPSLTRSTTPDPRPELR